MEGLETTGKLDWQVMRPALVRYLTRRTGCAAAAEDLTHDLWLKLQNASTAATDVRNPLAYVFRVAANAAFDWHRREAPINNAVSRESTALPDETPSAERQVQARQASALLYAAIQDLPPRCRAAFMLCRFEGLTMREAGRRLGVSERTVENHLAKATLHCRRRLIDAGAWP